MDKVNVSVGYELEDENGGMMEGHIVCPLRLPTYAAREVLSKTLEALNEKARALDKRNEDAKVHALKVDGGDENGVYSTRAMIERIESVRQHQIEHAWAVFTTVINRKAMTTDDVQKLDDPNFRNNCVLPDIKRIGDAFREMVGV